MVPTFYVPYGTGQLVVRSGTGIEQGMLYYQYRKRPNADVPVAAPARAGACDTSRFRQGVSGAGQMVVGLASMAGGVGIISGTVAEDVVTGGWGIIDDPFTIAMGSTAVATGAYMWSRGWQQLSAAIFQD